MWKYSKSILIIFLFLCSCKKNGENANPTIGVYSTSFAEEYITVNYPDNEVKRYDGLVDLVTALKYHQCDVISLDKSSVNNIVSILPYIYCVQDSVFASKVCVASVKDNKELIDQVNVFIRELRQSGKLEEINNRWINDVNSPMPVIENSGKNGKLLIATEGGAPPFNFIQDGHLAGIDIELISLFAARIEKTPEFHTSHFAGVISAVTTKKVDLGVSYISYTSARAETFCLSDPYASGYFGFYGIDESKIPKQSFTESLKSGVHCNLVAEQRYKLILEGLKNSLIIFIVALILGSVIGGVICYALMSKKKWLNRVGKVYVEIFRDIPIVVLLMIMYYVVLSSSHISGVWVAALTFALTFAAFVSQMYKTSIESVDRGQWDAGLSMGFSKLRTFIYIIVPQALKPLKPIFKGEAVTMLKLTSVTGYITVLDLTKAADYIRSRTFDAFFPLITVAIVYFLLSLLLNALLIERIRKG